LNLDALEFAPLCYLSPDGRGKKKVEGALSPPPTIIIFLVDIVIRSKERRLLAHEKEGVGFSSCRAPYY